MSRPPRVALALLAVALVTPSAGCEEEGVRGSEIEHRSPDGLTLTGTYYRQNTLDVTPTMILFHEPGPSNDRHDFDDVWAALLNEGFSLLAADLRSHGSTDSDGAWQDLALDPTKYPNDLLGWIDFISDREAAGDPVSRDRIGMIGLSTSASVAVAARMQGQVACAVAVSPKQEEVDALVPGFPLRAPDGDDDDSAAGDDDDSSAGDTTLDTIMYINSSGDQPSADDSDALFDATGDPRDHVVLDGSDHGLFLLLYSDDAKAAMVGWCADKL